MHGRALLILPEMQRQGGRLTHASRRRASHAFSIIFRLIQEFRYMQRSPQAAARHFQAFASVLSSFHIHHASSYFRLLLPPPDTLVMASLRAALDALRWLLLTAHSTPARIAGAFAGFTESTAACLT